MAAIYLITNNINGKKYVGQTMGCIVKRFKKHIGQINCKTKCEALCNAFVKYGVVNFLVSEIISGNFTKTELNILEIFYIRHYNTISPNGYNIQSGGQSSLNAPSTNKKIAAKMKGRKITWKDKVSLGMAERWKDPVYRAKMVATHTGKRGYKYKPHTKPNRLHLDEVLINELYKKGMTINAISKQLKISFYAIKKRIHA